MTSELLDRRHILSILSIILLAALACSSLPFLGDEAGAAADRIATLEAELAQARGTATVEASAGAGSDNEPTFTAAVEQDFTSATGAFALGEGAQVEDGALLLGPYEQCANDVANFDNPVNCLVVCTECGAQVAEYRMTVEFSFEDGLADREFGVILRLADEDGDHLIDRGDYLLALGFNHYDNRWSLYLHEPDQIEPWREITSGQAGFLRAGRLNQVEVQALENGQAMQVFLNGGRILNLVAADREPGERLVEPWADSGAVGFLGLGRGMTARFDNFNFKTAE